MVKKKEDRSDWVAVQPEVKAGGVDTAPPPPPIKAAKSAYQFFQKENSASIQQELNSGIGGGGGTGGTVVDVGTLGKEVSSRWQALSPSERGKYEELAEQDKLRFLSESRKRDIEALERRERLQKERETLILEDDDDDDDGNEGGRRRATTRRTRHKRERRAEKKRAKKEQKRKMKKMKMAASTAKKTKDSDDDSDYESDSNSAASSTYEDDSSDDDDASSSSSSSSASSSDSSNKKKTAKRRSPAKISQAVLDRRNLARKEKLEKEQYIEQRQSDVRNERAEQAKRRLEFLLKQSDIFSHFGNVKQEKARLGLSSSVASTTTSLEKGDEGEGEGGGDCKTIVRNKKPTNSATSSSASAGGNSNDDTIMKEVEEEEERQEVDEHEATYLTVQPSTLRGKMRQYQLEGLNVSFDIAIQEDHSFPPV